jgi:hypothetical protein
MHSCYFIFFHLSRCSGELTMFLYPFPSTGEHSVFPGLEYPMILTIPGNHFTHLFSSVCWSENCDITLSDHCGKMASITRYLKQVIQIFMKHAPLFSDITTPFYKVLLLDTQLEKMILSFRETGKQKQRKTFFPSIDET